MTLREDDLKRFASAANREARVGSVAIGYWDVATGLSAYLNPEPSFHAASTMKLCVMACLLRRYGSALHLRQTALPVENMFTSLVHANRFELDPSEDSDPGLYSAVGCEKSAYELAERMIVRSSNLATNILLDHLGTSKVNGLMASLGLEELVVRRGVGDLAAFEEGINNEVTCRGLTILLARLANHDLVSWEADEDMIAILRRQEFRDGIPAGLPEGSVVANKTGSIGGLFHDAGIVYPVDRDPYVLVVLTTGFEHDEVGPRFVSGVARRVHLATVGS